MSPERSGADDDNVVSAANQDPSSTRHRVCSRRSSRLGLRQPMGRRQTEQRGRSLRRRGGGLFGSSPPRAGARRDRRPPGCGRRSVPRRARRRRRHSWPDTWRPERGGRRDGDCRRDEREAVGATGIVVATSGARAAVQDGDGVIKRAVEDGEGGNARRCRDTVGRESRDCERTLGIYST